MGDFSVKSERSRDITVMSVSGRIDSVTAAALDEELAKVVRDNKKIVLNLNGVMYMSSAGVRAIVRALQSTIKSGGGVRLAGVPKLVEDVFETVGMMELLQLYPSVDEAVAGF